MPRQTLTVQLMHAQQRIAHLEAELQGAEIAVATLLSEVNVLKAAPQPSPKAAKPLPQAFDLYWDYVNAARKWCYANAKPVSYLSREDWVEVTCAQHS